MQSIPRSKHTPENMPVVQAVQHLERNKDGLVKLASAYAWCGCEPVLERDGAVTLLEMAIGVLIYERRALRGRLEELLQAKR